MCHESAAPSREGKGLLSVERWSREMLSWEIDNLIDSSLSEDPPRASILIVKAFTAERPRACMWFQKPPRPIANRL
jgi:hypothetical protein